MANKKIKKIRLSGETYDIEDAGAQRKFDDGSAKVAEAAQISGEATGNKTITLYGVTQSGGTIGNGASVEQTYNVTKVNAIHTELSTRIDNLESRGRYLSGWNCITGKPDTDPTSLPYAYKAGDYYIVSTVGTTNYKPSGEEYSGTASTVVEANAVQVGDIYTYDGAGKNWNLTHTPVVQDTNQKVKSDDNVEFGPNDVVKFVKGANVTSIAGDATAKTITINVKDTITTVNASASGSGNAVTDITADASGKLTLVKGETFAKVSELHSHANKAILDGIGSANLLDASGSASKAKLEGIASGAQVNVIENVAIGSIQGSVSSKVATFEAQTAGNLALKDTASLADLASDVTELINDKLDKTGEETEDTEDHDFSIMYHGGSDTTEIAGIDVAHYYNGDQAVTIAAGTSDGKSAMFGVSANTEDGPTIMAQVGSDTALMLDSMNAWIATGEGNGVFVGKDEDTNEAIAYMSVLGGSGELHQAMVVLDVATSDNTDYAHIKIDDQKLKLTPTDATLAIAGTGSTSIAVRSYVDSKGISSIGTEPSHTHSLSGTISGSGTVSIPTVSKTANKLVTTSIIATNGSANIIPAVAVASGSRPTKTVFGTNTSASKATAGTAKDIAKVGTAVVYGKADVGAAAVVAVSAVGTDQNAYNASYNDANECLELTAVTLQTAAISQAVAAPSTQTLTPATSNGTITPYTFADVVVPVVSSNNEVEVAKAGTQVTGLAKVASSAITVATGALSSTGSGSDVTETISIGTSSQSISISTTLSGSTGSAGAHNHTITR